MGNTILFVYGSLRRGQGAHGLLAGAEYLGEAVTEPVYRLVDLGAYPGLVVDATAGLAVRGELWRVDDVLLARLDEYEGVPELYRREPVRLAGGPERVEGYIFIGRVPAGARSGAGWPFTSD